MVKQHSHCSYCGSPFDAGIGWPRECAGCGNKSYLNPLPVAVVLLPVGEGMLVIRRNIEPSKGTLTLPGGYIDYGETWQEASAREMLEETGIAVAADELVLYDVMNGLDYTLIVFALAPRQPAGVLLESFCNEETQEVQVISGPQELGFPMHTLVVRRYFEEKS